MGLVCLAEGYHGSDVSGGRIRWDWCVWRKDTMGLVCLAEGYDENGVFAVGTSSSGAIIVSRRSPGGCK
jgi:hypothetical protein